MNAGAELSTEAYEGGDFTAVMYGWRSSGTSKDTAD